MSLRESIEPFGSARTISVAGETRAKNRDNPVIVPPEPTPATMASTLPSVCFQISGPVLRSCAAGLFGLLNWSV